MNILLQVYFATWCSPAAPRKMFAVSGHAASWRAVRYALPLPDAVLWALMEIRTSAVGMKQSLPNYRIISSPD
jgi:hypothetical protein